MKNVNGSVRDSNMSKVTIGPACEVTMRAQTDGIASFGKEMECSSRQPWKNHQLNLNNNVLCAQPGTRDAVMGFKGSAITPVAYNIFGMKAGATSDVLMKTKPLSAVTWGDQVLVMTYPPNGIIVNCTSLSGATCTYTSSVWLYILIGGSVLSLVGLLVAVAYKIYIWKTDWTVRSYKAPGKDTMVSHHAVAPSVANLLRAGYADRVTSSRRK